MSTESALAVIQGWSDILQEAIFLGQHTSGIALRLGLSLLREDFSIDTEILEEGSAKARFFREKVWTLFTTDKIRDTGLRLRRDYPWLLEFEQNRIGGFPGAISHFQHDPSGLIGILLAYSRLIDCEAVERNLLKLLRCTALDISYHSSEFRRARNQMSRLIHRFEKLKNVEDDNRFIVEYMNTDYLAIYEQCMRSFTHDKPGWFQENPEYKEWIETRGRIRQFIGHMPPCEHSRRVENMTTCILSLRTKALVQSSTYQERKLQAEIKKLRDEKDKSQKEKEKAQEEKENLQDEKSKLQIKLDELQNEKERLQDANQKLQEDNVKLQRDKETLEADKKNLQETEAKLQADNKKLQETDAKLQADKKKLREIRENLAGRLEVLDRAVTDMNYRHLLEMLPSARQAEPGVAIEPNPKINSEWQAFWKEAWAAAERGKIDPLNDLYVRSNKRKRTLIEEEGGRLYGVLSANVNDFENEYNVHMGVRDKIPGSILSALKPQNFTTEGDVDWEKEVPRFV